MFFSLMESYESKVKTFKLDRVSVNDEKGRTIQRIKLIRSAIKAYKPNTRKTWIENSRYFDELTELMAHLVADLNDECSGINQGRFVGDMETRINSFMKQKIADAYLGDLFDAELTRGKDVKYFSPTIPPMLDELNVFISGIEKEAKDCLEKLRGL